MRGMTPSEVDRRTRSAALLALWLTAADAVLFTAFAYLTTQVRSVRAGSPWQSDPYDGVVSFTVFLVPFLLALITARGTLLWRSIPQPATRYVQLLRAAVAATALIAATVATDLLAVLLRADHDLWNTRTPALVVSLVPLALLSTAALAAQIRALSALRTAEAPGRAEEDWLGDLARLIPARFADRLTTPIAFVRRHTDAVLALLALSGGIAMTGAEAIGEGWTSPVLVLTVLAAATGGFYGPGSVANAYLHIADPGHREGRGRVRRALRTAFTAGAFALPVSTVFRDALWEATGHGRVTTPQTLAGIVAVSGCAAAAAVFALAYALSRSGGPTRLARR